MPTGHHSEPTMPTLIDGVLRLEDGNLIWLYP